MEYFLAQLTDLQTDDSNVDNYAEKLIEDHEQELVQLGSFAAATGTYLPASIQGDNVQTSRQVLSAANTPSYVKTYLTTMVQTHTMDIQDNQQTLATTTNPTLVQFAQDDLPTDWMHRRRRAAPPFPEALRSGRVRWDRAGPIPTHAVIRTSRPLG